MCGIFSYTGSKSNAAELVLAGLKTLEYRGYDSWGIAVSDTDKLVIKKRVGKIGNATVEDMPASSCGFGHTRWATHGGVTDYNSHPHTDCSGKIALVHNGIIENYDVLKRGLVEKGHHFASDTDSEVAVHLIEEHAKSMSLNKAVQKTFKELEGLNAIIVLSGEDEKFYAVRNGSPLIVGFGDNENYLASDAASLLPHTKQVYFLEDYDMVVLSKTEVIVSDVRTGNEKKIQPTTLTWKTEQAQKGVYPHFMIKEIYEQPDIIADIANTSSESIQKIADYIKNSDDVYLIGCGTASYASIVGSYLFSSIGKRHTNWAVGSEFGYQVGLLHTKSVVVALSQSGETMDILESVKAAHQKKATILALTNALGSSLEREADYALLLGAGPEKGVASTKAFIAKIAHLILIAYSLADKLHKGRELLTHAVIAVRTLLTDSSIAHIKSLAKQIKNHDHIYVVGRGLSYPASLETALKIKEISYIHAEGFAAGELKHGVIALIEKGTPCMVIAPMDETYGATMSGAMEMKARGAYIIGISSKPHEVFDFFVPVRDVQEATIIPNVVVAQLLAYYLGLERGNDPDMPRNLAKSVTVK